VAPTGERFQTAQCNLGPGEVLHAARLKGRSQPAFSLPLLHSNRAVVEPDQAVDADIHSEIAQMSIRVRLAVFDDDQAGICRL
jgi:hypothetical protein